MSDRLRQALERALRGLEEALATAEEGWSYATDYTYKKWGAAEQLEAIRAEIAAAKRVLNEEGGQRALDRTECPTCLRYHGGSKCPRCS